MDLNAPADKPTAPLAECDLPQSATVLLLVDFINPLRFDGAQDIAEAALAAAQMTTELKRQLQGQGVASVYANDNYGQWRSEFHTLVEHCQTLAGASADMARLLHPGPDDLAILKPRHSAFYATPLEVLLQQMHTHQLVIVGLATDICVQMTAMDARLRGYDVWVPRDCTAAEQPRWHEEALSYLERVLRCDTRPSTQALQAWHRTLPGRAGTRLAPPGPPTPTTQP